ASTPRVEPSALAPLDVYPRELASAPLGEGGERTDLEGFYTAGRVTVGPQPTEDDLRALRAEGVGLIVNLRDSAATERHAAGEYDETALAERLGMRYVHIPLGGADGYAPEDLDAFREAVRGYEGSVLLHCASGGRARTMWKAYLIAERGVSPERAERIAESLGEGPTGLDRLLGEPEV
ncbi:MAG: sulfur transferase domain-containing protein, partial [Planctomycetota bacterium]